MKNLVYIGNQLSGKNKTPTTVETLGAFLQMEGFEVTIASSKSNKLLRFLDMILTVVLSRKKADYVLIDTYSTFAFYFACGISQLCRIFKLKYIPILHGGDLPKRIARNPILSKAIFENAYKNVAPSLYTKTNMEKLGLSNIICIPNSLELNIYPYKKRTLKSIKLLWVRSFSKIYNPFLAIDILKNFIDDGFEAELCMIGPENDGSLELTKAYAKEQGVSVSFTGKLSKKEWIILSEKYDIFINTTNIDNTPVSVIEAMALGLPIVSTNVGGMPFLIEHGVDGILVEPDDVNAFKTAITSLIGNPDDTLRMNENARRKVEQFNWEVVKEKWISLLA